MFTNHDAGKTSHYRSKGHQVYFGLITVYLNISEEHGPVEVFIGSTIACKCD